METEILTVEVSGLTFRMALHVRDDGSAAWLAWTADEDPDTDEPWVLAVIEDGRLVAHSGVPGIPLDEAGQVAALERQRGRQS